MAFYTDEHGNIVEEKKTFTKPTSTRASSALSIAKVFGYMFIGLMITGIIAFVLAFIFYNWAKTDSETASQALLITMIVASISTFILSFVVNFSLRKNKILSILIPGILYCVAIGVLLSTFVLFLDWRLLGGAFLATSLVFGVMALIALLSKGNLSGLAIVGMGLFFGAGIVSLFTWILMLVSPGTFQVFYWIITLGMFAGMMFITMFDIWRIKKIAEAGELSENVSLYCAFQLYVDFIYIFIRLVYFLGIAYSKK
ncbi:MAG: US12 family protein [Bacilli bacterium]|nr:US12 family protein [Bacilli bacterium]